MQKYFSLSLLISYLLISPTISAQDKAVNAAQKKIVEDAIATISSKVEKNVPVTAVTNSPMPEMLQVTSDLNVFYISKDGKYAFFGDLVAIDKDIKQWSVTEMNMRKLRAAALKMIPEKEMIIYPATKKKIANVYVFTDIDCPFCTKMQDKITEYNDLGIEIRYLAFPRAGVGSKTFVNTEKVWCAKNKQDAYEAAVTDKEYPEQACNDNSVAKQFELGQQMGVSGTPTMVLDNGSKIVGLVEPKVLQKIIEENT